MGDITKTAGLHQFLDTRQHLLAVTTVDHREQVVGPYRQTSWPPITQGHESKTAELLTDVMHPLVGDVPDHHRVGTIAQLMVPDHDAETLDHPEILQHPEACHHLALGHPQAGTQLGEGSWHQRQTIFDGLQQRAVTRVALCGIAFVCQLHLSANPKSMK